MTEITDNNYLNMRRDRRDRYVYRILSLEHFFQMFESNSNVLVKPALWEDPFENFIMNSKFRSSDGDVTDLLTRDLFYGQCWSKSKASDAMWRIYSPEKKGVRIRTTVRKLITSLASSNKEHSYLQYFVGGVKYFNNKKFTAFSQSALSGNRFPQAHDLARTLLVKRPAFKHENELRLLYFDVDRNNREDIFSYKISPHDLIDQIMVDPRVTFSEFRNLKDEIVSKTKFRGDIKRSKLYTLPKNIVIPFGP